MSSTSTFKFLPFLLISSLIACCIEIDISVPSFPEMSTYFGVSDGMIQLTLATNFLGFCIASLFYGPLSDSYGRRTIMLWGNGLLLLGALGCVFAPTLPILLGIRFVQGLGAATSAVVVFAMLSDVYKGEKAVKFIGIMNSVLTTLMSIAPVVGAFVTREVGFRGNYASVAIVAGVSWLLLVALLPETHTKHTAFSGRKAWEDYKVLFTSRVFMSACLIPSVLCAAYFGFVGCSSFLYMETFELSIVEYAFHQAAIIGSFAVISLFAGFYVKRFGQRLCIQQGISLCVLGILALLGLGVVQQPSPYAVTAAVMVSCIGLGLCYPTIFGASLEIFPEIKGTASSVIMSIRAFLITAVVGAVSALYTGELIRVALVLAVTVGVGALLTLQFLRESPEYKTA
jgi:DHA1 family bicyclomycin/chloramphenicol resistance-like MFS transporter